jgi:hypothetical protein
MVNDKTIHGVEALWFAKSNEIQKNSSWQQATGYCFLGTEKVFGWWRSCMKV